MSEDSTTQGAQSTESKPDMRPHGENGPPSEPVAPAENKPPGSSNPEYQSWGRYPQVCQEVRALKWRDQNPLRADTLPTNKLFLPQGLARSYGDSCLNDGNIILSTKALDRFIHFDRALGILRCESGVSLKDMLGVIVPAGWFLPVSPGTQFVTLGGAIANDIHGKNHHQAGTFGCHVLELTLRRSDGKVQRCSPTEQSDLFRATIGGLGLTGLIIDATIQLQSIETGFINSEEIQFSSLAEFHQLSEESASRFAYTVSWIDCVSTGKNFARGIFMRGNHARRSDLPVGASAVPPMSRTLAAVPFNAPSWALCPTTVRWFNGLYYHKQVSKIRKRLVPYTPFFYPLDSVLRWNRIYGPHGFFQFQCVIPPEPSGKTLQQLFRAIVDSGEASFLAVLKEFGSVESPGMLSFPRRGTTLCLDFANRGETTIRLYHRLEHMVREWQGALYPAKDALMEAQSFEAFFPQLSRFADHIDPRFSSSFWRRVTGPRVARMII